MVVMNSERDSSRRGGLLFVLCLLLTFCGTLSEGSAEETLRQSMPASSSIRDKYQDVVYAQKVWENMRDRTRFDTERRKYAADFDPWFKTWQQDPAAALREVRNFEPESEYGFFEKVFHEGGIRRQYAIKRGIDLQLLFEDFQDRYQKWKRHAKIFLLNERPDVSGMVDISRFFGSRPCMKPRRESIFECGSPPDWRSETEKVEDERIAAAMKKVQQSIEAHQAVDRLRRSRADKIVGLERMTQQCAGTSATETSGQRDNACDQIVLYEIEIRALDANIDALDQNVRTLRRDAESLKDLIDFSESPKNSEEKKDD